MSANIESSSYSIHSVLHRWCFHSSDMKKIETAWLAIMVVTSATPRNFDIDYTLLQRRFLPHCNCFFSLLQQNIPEDMNGALDFSLSNACHSLGNLYSDQGIMLEAEAMSLWALAGYEKASEPNHPYVLATVNVLGNLYSKQGKMAKSETLYLRALADFEKAWGLKHTTILNTVNNLGNLYLDQGKLAEAETMYLRGLTGYEKSWGPEHTNTLTMVNNSGGLYLHQGKWQRLRLCTFGR